MKYYAFGPVRNCGETIGRVVASLVHQTVPPERIILVNDGSTDDTLEVMERWQKWHPNIEIITTDSTTSDFARIPGLLNMCLRKGYDYHMVAAGDTIFERDYAQKVLYQMKSDSLAVVASGSAGESRSRDPRGAGRFVRQDFFYRYYDGYPEIAGYESEILFRARIAGYAVKVVGDARFMHTDRLGHSHNFTEFGWGMRALGYHPLYVLGRTVTEFLRNDRVGRRGACNMLKSYLTYRPEQAGYHSMFPEDVRREIRGDQKRQMAGMLKRLFGGTAR